ncbi:MAG: family 1 glycosylhydrolase [Acidobacteriota bacterium]|nr:family 1 glycosylhydrolase [Acidobacteriota bacterium]
MPNIGFGRHRDHLAPTSNGELEVWGGVEYTHNRVQGRYFDQMDLSGHSQRPGDYELIAALGITTYRFGLLWERFERDRSWRWADERLDCLKRAGMRPIASLVHHGSGPRHTSLLDPEFPEKLARYAGAVAERYPWVDAYTPVNEPNTTARFSGMYGVWYPHHTSRRSYLQALLHQLKGTVLSMEAIRRVRSDAHLIQTDDVGNIGGTEELRDTWELLNQRQWLTYDLLCGRVNREHPLFQYIQGAGIDEREVLWFADHPCPPNVIGVNYYATSDRFLDHRTERYSADRRSAEGAFVDVEAVRVRGEGLAGVDTLLREAWRRYGIPVAITEAHLGDCVEEQIRWLAELWHGAQRVRHDEVQCVAIAVWALLGSFYWNELVTCENGHYEPGAFDVSSGIPKATGLAEVVAQIARGEAPEHPALGERGWWRNDGRGVYPWEEELAQAAA